MKKTIRGWTDETTRYLFRYIMGVIKDVNGFCPTQCKDWREVVEDGCCCGCQEVEVTVELKKVVKKAK